MSTERTFIAISPMVCSAASLAKSWAALSARLQAGGSQADHPEQKQHKALQVIRSVLSLLVWWTHHLRSCGRHGGRKDGVIAGARKLSVPASPGSRARHGQCGLAVNIGRNVIHGSDAGKRPVRIGLWFQPSELNDWTRLIRLAIEG